MKTLVILFADSRSLHLNDKIFDSQSSFDFSLNWALSTSRKYNGVTEIFASDALKSDCSSLTGADGKSLPVIYSASWTVTELFSKFSEEAKKNGADTIVFAWADCPFINSEITEEILKTHRECKAEYTFADGYVNGLCPEVLDAGAASILAELSKNQKADEGAKTVTRTSVFDLIKNDINSFEVETVIADFDARLFRVNFNCGTKANAEACRAMFKNGIAGKSINEISEGACKNVSVLKTVPGWYNLQLTDRCNSQVIYHPEGIESPAGSTFVSLSDFKKLVKKISDFSETAVVSLSAFGQAELHPDFVEMVKTVLSEPGLSVLIEGDMLNVTEEQCAEIKAFSDSVPERTDGGAGNAKIMWLVTLDAASGDKYCQIHNTEVSDQFENSKNAVSMLEKYFGGSVYPQFVRMNENEDELEGFYRFWSDKNSPSHGNLVIQKYDSFCGSLPERKPADLSPLERNACWHIRRDITVLADGSVPFCRCQLKSNIIGNAFTEELSEIWKKMDGEVKNHLDNKYSGKCGTCDEYYTFNF